MFSLFNFWFETVLECASCPRVSLGFNFMPVACTKKKQNKANRERSSPLHVKRTWEFTLFLVRACISGVDSFSFALLLHRLYPCKLHVIGDYDRVQQSRMIGLLRCYILNVKVRSVKILDITELC